MTDPTTGTEGDEGGSRVPPADDLDRTPDHRVLIAIVVVVLVAALAIGIGWR